MLPVSKLRDYLGDALAKRAMVQPEGIATEAMQVAGQWHVLLVRQRRAASPPSFSQARKRVLGLWLRRQGEDRLRAFLRESRRGADIRRATVL